MRGSRSVRTRAWLAGMALFGAAPWAGRADEPSGPLVVLVSEPEPVYEEMVRAWGRDVQERRPAAVVRVRALEGLAYDDARALEILEETRRERPALVVCVGMKAALLASGDETLPVVCCGVPDAMTEGIREHQKEGRFLNVHGAAWGDHAAAAAALRAVHDLLPAARRVGLLYSEPGGRLVGDLRKQGEELELTLEAERLESVEQAGPAIRRLAARVDAFLVPKDRIASAADVRRAVLEIASGERNIPVFSVHASDVVKGALAAVDIDPAVAGRRAADLCGDLLEEGLPRRPVFRSAPESVLARRFNVRLGRAFGVAPPGGKEWEKVEPQ